MKKLLYILTVLFFAQGWAQSALDEGNALYKDGKYNEAAKKYQTILDNGNQSAEVYFNLANAYYKMDAVAPAIYNYEKALLLKPNYKDAKINLDYAQKMVIDDIQAVPQVGFSKMVYNFTGAYHYDAWAWGAVVAAFLFLLFFLGYYFAGTTVVKRIFFVGMFVALLGIVVTILSATFVKSEEAKQRPAIVFNEVVSVKSEPRDAAQDAFILHEGTKVLVKETLGNWKKIELADDSEGWVEKDAIKELK
ncbi:tetratricopeptide repeat protein [Flavobacterium arcticum]|uniref:Tetratricopeptide repeat protein n=1 Tax=Flavobacterium arcticum TaxID=1784713 RepID=A0A345HBE9_9FLAO|nr:tetratricopeptide repeat protein [Flavobacterium arcticum]AXG73909.1 tetratricopeptide repeat protein [Flavobacterium arcticum]KAF2508886.1 tetratricopeptide repeat protein [Flavobacterium arcticum]